MFIPYGRQDVQRADIAAIEEILKSDFLTQGPMIARFEAAMVAKFGARHAVAVNSATSALHLACLALDVGPGDRVWTSAITFVASANCARYCGAAVDFVDIDPDTYNLSIVHLSDKLETAEREGTLPKVVVAVHLTGQPCQMAELSELARRYRFKLIEDAAHAIGGRYRDEPIGNCRFSDITVFSFHPVKLITTGEGGLVLANDGSLADRVASLRSHGITRDELQMTRAADGPWYYEQLELGYNYRMTDIQAALGLSQLQRLDDYVAARHSIAARYDEHFEDDPVVTPWQHGDAHSAYHLYVVRLRLGKVRQTHRQVFDDLRAAGIQVNLHYIPLYRQPYYARMGFRPEDFPESERYYQEAISLPLYPTLTDDQQAYVVRTLRQAIY